MMHLKVSAATRNKKSTISWERFFDQWDECSPPHLPKNTRIPTCRLFPPTWQRQLATLTQCYDPDTGALQKEGGSRPENSVRNLSFLTCSFLNPTPEASHCGSHDWQSSPQRPIAFRSETKIPQWRARWETATFFTIVGFFTWVNSRKETCPARGSVLHFESHPSACKER